MDTKRAKELLDELRSAILEDSGGLQKAHEQLRDNYESLLRKYRLLTTRKTGSKNFLTAIKELLSAGESASDELQRLWHKDGYKPPNPADIALKTAMRKVRTLGNLPVQRETGQQPKGRRDE